MPFLFSWVNKGLGTISTCSRVIEICKRRRRQSSLSNGTELICRLNFYVTRLMPYWIVNSILLRSDNWQASGQGIAANLWLLTAPWVVSQGPRLQKMEDNCIWYTAVAAGLVASWDIGTACDLDGSSPIPYQVSVLANFRGRFHSS